MLVKPGEMNFNDKKISMIIAGVPGIGKTTLALSSPKPLLIDLDKGVSRVEAKYRKDTLVVNNFNELQDDLSSVDLSSYETLVIDTGGKLLEMLKSVVIAKDAKNGKRDGTLSLQGYGAIKREFTQFIQYVKSFNKNLVLVFHASEVNLENDSTGLRIRMEGSSKDDVWDDIDIGGFVEMNGKKRTIGFNNCDRYYAKGTHGVHGVYEIPDLSVNTKNDFLTQLFDKIKHDLNVETEELNKYTQTVEKLKIGIFNAENTSDLNKAYNEIATAEHHLTSKEELWFMLNEKAREIGAVYDKNEKCFK